MSKFDSLVDSLVLLSQCALPTSIPCSDLHCCNHLCPCLHLHQLFVHISGVVLSLWMQAPLVKPSQQSLCPCDNSTSIP